MGDCLGLLGGGLSLRLHILLRLLRLSLSPTGIAGHLGNSHPVLAIVTGVILFGEVTLLDIFSELFNGIRPERLPILVNVNLHGVVWLAERDGL